MAVSFINLIMPLTEAEGVYTYRIKRLCSP